MSTSSLRRNCLLIFLAIMLCLGLGMLPQTFAYAQSSEIVEDSADGHTPGSSEGNISFSEEMRIAEYRVHQNGGGIEAAGGTDALFSNRFLAGSAHSVGLSCIVFIVLGLLILALTSSRRGHKRVCIEEDEIEELVE